MSCQRQNIKWLSHYIKKVDILYEVWHEYYDENYDNSVGYSKCNDQSLDMKRQLKEFMWNRDPYEEIIEDACEHYSIRWRYPKDDL